MKAYGCRVAASVLAETVRGYKTRESGKGEEPLLVGTAFVQRFRVVVSAGKQPGAGLVT